MAIAGIGGISHRFASVWKVQNTGSVGTVRVAWEKSFQNLSLIQSADASIDASDVVTGMASNEVTINGVVYNYADVTLGNGQYFTFAAKVAAPGGVFTDLRVWLKSENGFAPAEWQDHSGNAKPLYAEQFEPSAVYRCRLLITSTRSLISELLAATLVSW